MKSFTPRLEIVSLTKCYGDKVAVSELTLSIGPGECFCFLGRNGAGKTTTIHTIVGHKNPTSGDVLVNGVSVKSPEIHGARRRLGYVAEQPVLYDYLTGREYLAFVADLYDVPASRRRWIDEKLDQIQLASDADVLIKEYSLGTKKKVAFLAALVHDPDILMLDEPTGSLDAPSARLVKDLMVEARDGGKLVFFTTHVMEIAERLADRLAIIDRGGLVTQGTLEDLRSKFGRTRTESLEEIFLRITDDASHQSDPAVRVGRSVGSGVNK